MEIDNSSIAAPSGSSTSTSQPGSVMGRVEISNTSVQPASVALQGGPPSYPKKEGESLSAWARRLKNKYSHLSTGDACDITGVNETTLRQIPAFKTLTRAAEDMRNATPRLDKEIPTAWVRRLKRKYPHLSPGDACAITGVNEKNLRQISEFKTLSRAAEDMRNATPRLDEETPTAWARRLKNKYLHLSPGDACAITGLNETTLRQISEFKTLSRAAEDMRNATPRLDEETTTAWIRRLRKEYQDLSSGDACAITGVNEANLRQMPEFKILSRAAEDMRNATPRLDEEAPTAWIRRLKKKYTHLSPGDACAITGVNETYLRQMSAFKTLSRAAEDMRNATPRLDKETPTAWVRRLKRKYPHLSTRDACAITGVNETYLRQMSEFKTLSRAAEDMRNATPRLDKETPTAWVRRLKKKYSHLSPGDACAITGLNEATLRMMSDFKTLSRAAEDMRNATPQLDEETPRAWVRRLKKEYPHLSTGDACAITGLHEANLRQMPEFRARKRDAEGVVVPLPSSPSVGEEIDSMVHLMELGRATPIGYPHVNPYSPVHSVSGEINLTPANIEDIANLLLLEPARFNNQLSDNVPGMLLASGALPDNTVITIEEPDGVGGMRILRRNLDSVTEPQASELHVALILNRGRLTPSSTGSDPSAHYTYRDRRGNILEPGGEPGDCFYRAVSGALRLHGRTGRTVAALRKAVAREFTDNPSFWLGFVDHGTLLDELQKARGNQ